MLKAKLYLWLLIWLGTCLFSCEVWAVDIDQKMEGSTRLWEYERQEYLSMLKLSPSEITAIQKSEKYSSTDGAKLLLALNCIRPKNGAQYENLYMYRCEGGPLSYIAESALYDPYILAFVKQSDKSKAIYYLKEYLNFLESVQLSGKGIPIGASSKEYISEIIRFLEMGGIADVGEAGPLDINQVKAMLQKEGVQSVFSYLVQDSFLNTEDKAANKRTNEFLNHIDAGDKEWFSILTQFYKAGLIDGIYGEVLSGAVSAALSTNPELVFSHWKAIGYEPRCGHYPAEMGDPGPVDTDTSEALKALLPQRLAVSNVKGDEFKAVKSECLDQINSSIKSMVHYANEHGFNVSINGTNFSVRPK